MSSFPLLYFLKTGDPTYVFLVGGASILLLLLLCFGLAIYWIFGTFVRRKKSKFDNRVITLAPYTDLKHPPRKKP